MKKNTEVQARARSQPPEPPAISRSWQFHRLQLVGIPLIMLLPILALFGVFGETFDSTSAASPELALDVEYPSRFRYKMINSVGVSVENTSAEPLPLVKVTFDRGYIDQFSTVSFTPDVKSITAEAYLVELEDVQPREKRFVTVEIQGERYWQHHGTITAQPGGGKPVAVAINTFIFP